MKATILKIVKKPSKFGGFFYYVFFQGAKGGAYFSCIYPRMRNFKRWKHVLKEGVVLDNLKLVRGKKNLINADSNYVIVKEK